MGHIYVITISLQEYEKYSNNIDGYLYRNYHLKENNISYMVSDKKLEIETIEKV